MRLPFCRLYLQAKITNQNLSSDVRTQAEILCRRVNSDRLRAQAPVPYLIRITFDVWCRGPSKPADQQLPLIDHLRRKMIMQQKKQLFMPDHLTLPLLAVYGLERLEKGFGVYRR